ncbi:carotenoid 1,2-hydratase [Ramlibacter sp. USB13]|uniref:Carotenoid 1,2-hydratase n=1 Tax=Ramlibacter cellulosilyticus TaxID=2764187 RepID=A0A923MPB9_9BURK|nr:carotenoid 1,2-hydratase [Ramlibacter cellulosilyticus]MBC5782371.1 carotenoid 1,2-hydratase [Ramlibacter cellulosilyticus]
MPPIRRRPLLAALPALALARAAWALPPRRMAFPGDHGAHPDLRTEWWYITGQAQSGGRTFGFQVTFFRSRVDATQQMQSRFAAKQLLFAHAAVTDVQGAKLLHDQRIARAGFGIADAATGNARLRLRDWSLVREDGGTWHAVVPATGFALDLRCAPTQPVLLQGDAGLSRKGPLAQQASYYYSEPQLAVSGAMTLQGRKFEVTGRAWMDHEWSDEYLAPEAAGWDWVGMNLDDGSALMAFRIRRPDGSTYWDGGAFRSARGDVYIASRGETEFRAHRRWTSPASGASYPVEWGLRTPADFYTVRALIDNQELDSRGSTGAIYWEGLSDLLDSNGRRVGRGYLEMTGYATRLKM